MCGVLSNKYFPKNAVIKKISPKSSGDFDFNMLVWVKVKVKAGLLLTESALLGNSP